MILTFGDRTYLMFCFLGCVVEFQASEANGWRRSESSNPGNRVCVLFSLSFFLFYFFSFLLLAFSLFYLSFFSFIKVVKPVRHHTNRFFNDLASSRSNAHTHKNKGGANRRGKAERRQRAVLRFTRFVDYELMFDSRGVHLVSKMVCFVHRISNP